MKNFVIKVDKLIIMAVVVIFIYLSPFIFLGENSHEYVFDGLDSNTIIYKLLVESGEIFGKLNAEIPNAMNGISRISLGSELSFIVFFNYLFSPFIALVINYFIMRYFAFFSLLVFFRKWITSSDEDFIAILVSLIFALLPFAGPWGLTIPALPLVLHVFLKIRNREDKWLDWFILFIIPFYSSFVYCYVFFLSFIMLLFFYDLLIKKIWNLRFLLSILFMGLTYLFVEYRLVAGMLLGKTSFVSHRTVWNPAFFGNNTLIGSIKRGYNFFAYGMYFAKSCHFYILITTIIALITLLIKQKFDKLLVSLLIFNFVSSLLVGLHSWSGLNFLREKYNILLSFNITRFYSFWPFIWYLIFAVCLTIIYSNLKYGKKIVLILILIQTIYVVRQHNEFVLTEKKIPSFKEYYSVELYKNIDEYLGKNKSSYNVLNIGIHPAVSLYNGFNTLGGYFMTYPLEFKKRFRKIIEKELEKNKNNKFWFDGWGSRCYVLPAELNQSDKIYSKDKGIVLKDLELDTEAIKELGGKYIFSAFEIRNFKSNNLKFLKSFENKVSPWKIFVYEII